MHYNVMYKYLSQSPNYFGHYYNEPVNSLNALVHKAKAESDPNEYASSMGIGMTKGSSTGRPGIAQEHNLSEAEDADKTSPVGDR